MRCPKCQGCIIVSYDDRYCINYAKRFHVPDAPPIVVEEARRWISVLCRDCERTAVRGYDRCRAHWNKKKVDNGQEKV